VTPGLVSVITPSRRGGAALKRCVESVQEQSYAHIEHIVVIDEGGEGFLPGSRPGFAVDVRILELNDLWRTPVTSRSTGAWPWFIGTQFTRGEYVMFLGDDDEYLPHHIERHVEAMGETGADYSLSIGEFWVDGEFVLTVGDGTVRSSYLDSDGIACRRDTLKVANWTANGGSMPDFELVWRWHNAKLRGAFVNEITYRHHDGWLSSHPDVIEAAKKGEDWRRLLTVS
jgi:glycosyltransferase involved in cell wall biosynthesis